jgi:hypothetical protein
VRRSDKRLQLLHDARLRPCQVDCYDTLFAPERLLPSACERVFPQRAAGRTFLAVGASLSGALPE